MGLDVSTYANLKKVDDRDDADFQVYVADEDWEFKVKHLEIGASYCGDRIHRGISYGYSTHNRFRETLIKLINRTDLLDDVGRIIWRDLQWSIPFYDFINFSDCEGCLDHEVSRTIYLDFEKYNDLAKESLDEYSYSSYRTWMETFKTAMDNGVVVFS
jgi:hypothetical protein